MASNNPINSVCPRTVAFVGCLLCLILMAGCSSVSPSYDTPSSVLPHTALSYGGSSELKRRFQPLSELSVKGSPNFYEYLVKKADVPALDADQTVLRIVFEERVFFDTGRWDVRRDAASILRLVANSLQKFPTTSSLFVAGHTDSRGGDAYNLELSVKRANSVGQALLRMGVGSTKIWRVGFGKAVPLKANDTAENMAINRRVEFIVSDKREAIGYWLTKQGEFLCSAEGEALPELCKEAASAGGTFQAVEVTPAAQSQVGTAKPAEESNVSTQKVETIQLTLQPPTIQSVGRPTQ